MRARRVVSRLMKGVTMLADPKRSGQRISGATEGNQRRTTTGETAYGMGVRGYLKSSVGSFSVDDYTSSDEETSKNAMLTAGV
jgi:hypothetical protein